MIGNRLHRSGLLSPDAERVNKLEGPVCPGIRPERGPITAVWHIHEVNSLRRRATIRFGTTAAGNLFREFAPQMPGALRACSH